MARTDRTFWTRIPGTGRKEMIRYDIWSNIHYGYVGRSHGIPAGLLLAAQRNNDPGDDLSVEIGIRLWRKEGLALSNSDLHEGIVREIRGYRSIRGVVKRIPHTQFI